MTVKEQALLEGVTPQAIYMRRWRERHPEASKAYMRGFFRTRREQVLAHYGGQCVCCGEDSYEFLAVDHKNGGGTQHRAEVGRGSNMIEWIIKNEFPDVFQVMCHNCNQAIGYYGYCPHENALHSVAGDK